MEGKIKTLFDKVEIAVCYNETLFYRGRFLLRN